ncbi:zinc-dependent metalloprotease [Silvibacterium sp.]|uniref:zinc-dependent metalloprotease n=1 Tax=Silvibacterium sp. TaxID=1964179 RepID=UPI0039E445AF
MYRSFKLAAALLPAAAFCSLLTAAPAIAQSPASDSSISKKTTGMRHWDGFLPMDWDAKSGKLYLEVSDFDKEFLLLDQLPYGVGSNDLGLDRGQLGHGRVVRFYRSGNKVLLIERNLTYRSSAADPDERLAVEQSFARSVVWGFPVEAEENGKVLLDATGFFLRDPHGVGERLQQAKQGEYSIDSSRSVIVPEDTKDFPENTEVQAMITFAAHGHTGKLIDSVTPDPHAVTVEEHTSLIQLPDDHYKPRAFDIRAGYFPESWRDYSTPLGDPIDLNYIIRHRLEKKDPNAATSDPVKPIVYYVDRGAPEPIRSALVEGASWWNQAFEAAGFRNAFQVKVLPEGADPMDIRYNMIQWVHRSTRGWSYGEAVTDPRTGEIIKGQVTLGSLRARQDYLIAEALLSPYEQGKPVTPEMKEMVLARIRQLAAHEVGHTLGLAHNFAASSVAPGTSVMDYPHPWVTLDANGRPDLSHAYPIGIGTWDKVAIAYGYSEFKPGSDEKTQLDKILRTATDHGLLFITDEDSRPLGSAHPHAHLWDNGADPADELNRILDVRAAALSHFGEGAIPLGQPMSELEQTLVPLYLLHRYQTQAAAKEIGGLDYRYALRGDGQLVTAIVSPEEQHKALDAVLKTLDPATLTLPESLLKILPPTPPGYDLSRSGNPEPFPGHTGLTFDPEGAVESAANLTLDLLFEPSRASRLVQYHDREPAQPSLDEVIEATLKASWYAPHQSGLAGLTQFTVEDAVLNHLLALAASSDASPQAAAQAEYEASKLNDWLKSQTVNLSLDPDLKAAYTAAEQKIAAFEKNPAAFKSPETLDAPPGQPIGSDDDDTVIY